MKAKTSLLFTYTDFVGVKAHKFAGLFGRFKNVLIGLEVDEGDYETTFCKKAPDNAKD